MSGGLVHPCSLAEKAVTDGDGERRWERDTGFLERFRPPDLTSYFLVAFVLSGLQASPVCVTEWLIDRSLCKVVVPALL